MTYPTLQRYNQAVSTPLANYNNTAIVVDSANNRVFTIAVGTSADAGIRVHDIDTGDEIAAATIGDLGITDIDYPIALSPDGRLLVMGQAYLNGTRAFLMIDGDTLTIVDTWNGTNYGGGVPHLPEAPGVPSVIATTSKAGYSYAAAPVVNVLGNTITFMEAGGNNLQFAGYEFTPDEGPCYSCGTPAGIGKFFHVSLCVGGFPSTNPFGLYKTTVLPGADSFDTLSYPLLTNGAFPTVKLGAYNPSDIDATWTHITYLSQPGHDNSDGNILMYVGTSDAVADQKYLIKFDSTTGVILWKLSITDIPSSLASAFNSGLIDGGYLYYKHIHNLYQIDTATGLITSTLALNVFFNSNDQYYDYITASIYVEAQWQTNTAPPYPSASTPTAGPEKWFRMQLSDVPVLVPPYLFTFSDLHDTTHHDWLTASGTIGEDFSSYLNTYYHMIDDNMFWLESPYVYIYLENSDVWDDSKSLLMQGAFDWSDSAASHHWSAQEQVYRFRNYSTVAVSRKKVRGNGRVLQLRFESEESKDFNLLAWGVWIDKQLKP